MSTTIADKTEVQNVREETEILGFVEVPADKLWVLRSSVQLNISASVRI